MDAIPEDTLSALQDAGLTVYQARAYVTLLQTGSVRVLPLSRASGVPRNKLYHVLTDLERMSLVEAVNREPLEVKALPARPYLERRISRLQSLLQALAVAAPRPPEPAPERESPPPAASPAPEPSPMTPPHPTHREAHSSHRDYGSASQQA